MRGEKKEEYHRGYLRRAREWRGALPPVGGDVLFEFRGRGTGPLGLVVFAELVFGHCVCGRDNGV